MSTHQLEFGRKKNIFYKSQTKTIKIPIKSKNLKDKTYNK